MTTIFYSWMTGRPNATNRGFVADALDLAVQALGSDAAIDEAPRVDRDTVGMPGAPDIAATIFEKIDAADIFVADLTLIETVDAETKRPTPNPNVLVELGYALKTLGWERIIMVFNDAFGAAENLPFDLRGRRITPFNMAVDAGERAPERKRLARVFEDAVRAILKHAENEPRSAWFGRLAQALVPMLTELENFVLVNAELHSFTFDGWAKELRELARDRFAEQAEKLRALAELCDHGAYVFENHIGYEMESVVEQVRTAAATLKRDTIDVLPVAEETARDAFGRIRRVNVEVKELVSRMDKMVEMSRIDQLQESASRLGGELLFAVELPLPIEAEALQSLREAVHRLHRIEHIELLIDGGETINEITGAIREASDVLDQVAGTLPKRRDRS